MKSPRAKVCGASNWSWEKPEPTHPGRDAEDLTQAEFDAPVWRVRRAIARRGENKEAEPAAETNTAEARFGRFSRKKTNRLRCRAPTVRSSAASRIAGCSRSRAIFRTS